MNTQSDTIWIDGELLPYELAMVHALTPTLHTGVGVVASMRCYETDRGPAVLRLEAHLKSFMRSINALGFVDVPYDVTALREAVHKTIIANHFTECYVRVLMFLGGGLGLDLGKTSPRFCVATWNWDDYWQGDKTDGLSLCVSSYARSQTLMSSLPSKLVGNYPLLTVAKTLAVQSGFDGACLLDGDGYIADCTGETLFMVRDNKLHTPRQSAHFGGITRKAVMTLADDLGIEVDERNLSREQLYVADELFVCGTAGEVQFVKSIDHHEINQGKMGSITSAIQDSYQKTAKGVGKRSAEWLNYVGDQPYF